METIRTKWMRRLTLCLTPLVFSPTDVTIYHAVPSSVYSQSKDDSAMTIVTYNIRGCRDDDGIADPSLVASVLAELNADVIALQEVDYRLPRSRFVDQVASIAGSLEMNYVYAPSLSLVIGTYGNALLSRHPILHAEVLSLPGSWEPRSLLDVTLDWNGTPLHVYVTHLGVHKSEHPEQIAFLHSHLQENSENTGILLGDFNILPNDPLLDSLRTVYDDPLHRQEQRLITLKGKHSFKEVDRILLSPNLLFVEAAAPAIGPSDHFPLWMKIKPNALAMQE
ncbi:endonuclease/exonuclease/phosphatase family protein [Brevibacillus invocatus]|nr:endonuclease/exonuclease/phosphatase family protein [Brevibacillus invocatus]